MKIFANRVMLGLLAFSLSAWMAAAADVSGIWKGTLTWGKDQSESITFNLHENAGVVMGTEEGLGPTGGDIANGKVAGDQISFDVNGKDNHGKNFTMNFSGKISGNQITGELPFGGKPLSVSVTKQ